MDTRDSLERSVNRDTGTEAWVFYFDSYADRDMDYYRRCVGQGKPATGCK